MRIQIIALVAALALPMPALADTITYTYTGQDFLYFNANGEPQVFTDSDSVDLALTLSAPLADNLTSLTAITPTSFSFSDGYQTITNLTASSDLFEVETNSVGGIVGWDMDAELYTADGTDIIETISANGYASDTGEADLYPYDYSCGGYYPCVGYDYSEGFILPSDGISAGTWSPDPMPPAATPEPGSLMLVATGLLGGAAFVRRRALGQEGSRIRGICDESSRTAEARLSARG